MFKVTRLTDYALVVLADLARRGEAGASVATVAVSTGLNEPTVAKVLKLLSAPGLVEARRGAQGGFHLTRPATAITLADVLTAMEGPIAITACVEGSDEGCARVHHCGLSTPWNRVNLAIKAALSAVTLAEMVPQPVNFLIARAAE